MRSPISKDNSQHEKNSAQQPKASQGVSSSSFQVRSLSCFLCQLFLRLYCNLLRRPCVEVGMERWLTETDRRDNDSCWDWSKKCVGGSRWLREEKTRLIHHQGGWTAAAVNPNSHSRSLLLSSRNPLNSWVPLACFRTHVRAWHGHSAAFSALTTVTDRRSIQLEGKHLLQIVEMPHATWIRGLPS